MSKIIQLTNSNIGVVAIGSRIPFGVIDIRCPRSAQSVDTFTVTTSGADTLTINKGGLYKFIYNASIVATAAGVLTLTLYNGSTAIGSISQTVSGAGDTENLNFVKEIYLPSNCQANPYAVPANFSIVVTGSAITTGTSTLIVET